MSQHISVMLLNLFRYKLDVCEESLFIHGLGSYLLSEAPDPGTIFFDLEEFKRN